MSLNDTEQKALVKALPEDLRLSEESYISEEDFLNALMPKVAYMLQYNSAVFFQLLYKLDVLEPKLKIAMQQEDVPMAIAKLILERQIEKIVSRRLFPAQKSGDEELKW
ncbi:MAG: hypothetical protein QM530_11070 [Phycisphaerales bacterium]|nr:hypothetical protein [Phycisphaerales bacterium]